MTEHPVARFRKYPPGAVIVCEETAGDRLFIIRRGRVRVLKRSRRGDVLLAEMGPGNLFGEMTLIDRKLRSASVIAMEETTCIELPYTMIEDLVERSSPWIVAILRILVLRLRAADTALAGQRDPGESAEIPIDQLTERHMRRIVKKLEETQALEWERLAHGR